MNDTINIPEDLSEITLQQYVRYSALPEELTDVERMIQAINILCNYSNADKLPYNEVLEIAQHLKAVLSKPSKLIRRFEVTSGNESVEFGFITNLDKMSFKEYIDLDMYVGDWKTFNKAMAVLYRPVIESKGELYKIAEYNGTDDYSNLMQYAPVDVVLGVMVFFWTLRKDLSNHTLHYLNNQKKILMKIPDIEVSQKGKTLIENMDGIHKLINSLTMTLPNIQPSLNYQYIKCLPKLIT